MAVLFLHVAPHHATLSIKALTPCLSAGELAFGQMSSLVAQTVKNLSPMQETKVSFLGWEYPLEKEMATHSSVLAYRIPWTEEPDGLQSMESQRIGHD